MAKHSLLHDGIIVLGILIILLLVPGVVLIAINNIIDGIPPPINVIAYIILFPVEIGVYNRLYKKNIARTTVEKECNLGVPWMNDDACLAVALKELEERGLIKDRHGDDWKATERGII